MNTVEAQQVPFETVTFGMGELSIDLLCCSVLSQARVPHGFSFRRRRLATATPFGERHRGESDRKILSRLLGVDTFAYMKQVHGDRVLGVHTGGEVGECDGLVSRSDGDSNLGLAVHTADCVPVLFWDEASNRVAACHAGWRGTRARIAAITAGSLLEKNADRTSSLHVVLGPAIRQCCFEVSADVPQAFEAAGFTDVGALMRPGRDSKYHFDLIRSNRRQLEEVGVSPERIYDSGRCTKCDNASFYSYRAEGPGAGRVMSIIAPRQPQRTVENR